MATSRPLVTDDGVDDRTEKGPFLTGHGEIAIVMKIRGESPKIANLSDIDKAIKMVIDDVGNDELMTFLRRDISLLDRAKDWVRFVSCSVIACKIQFTASANPIVLRSIGW